MPDRSLEQLLAEAEQAIAGRVSVAEFIASVDWNVGAIGQRAGEYGPQAANLVHDAIDRAASGAGEVGPTEIRALAAAVTTIAREGSRPEAITIVHQQLASVGLVGGAAPEPRPTGRITTATAVRAGGPDLSRSIAEPEDAPPEVDPALDPEIARLTRRFAPRARTLQPLAVLGLGWAVVLALVGGIALGIWIDGQYGTAPLATIVGVAVGLALAFVSARSLIRQSRAR